MAKPPAGSSLLFGGLANSGRIKQRKNGSYRVLLKGVDEIHWYTDRPDRVAGEWTPKKLVKKWGGLFADSEPNAQASFEMGRKRELVTFEMFKPKLSDSKQTLNFKVRGIGEENKDLLTGLKNKRLLNMSLFIDNAASLPNSLECYPDEYCVLSDLVMADLSGIDLREGKFFKAYFTKADLTQANLSGTALEESHFAFANLGNANLRGTKINKGDWSKANLNAADFSGATITNSIFEGADLRGVILRDANVGDVDLRGTNLVDADLTGMKISMRGSSYPDQSIFGAIENSTWGNTTCPDGTMNDGDYPCTLEQLTVT